MSRCRIALVLLAQLALAACNGPQDPVARGRYLANVGGCNDCHTPKIFTATSMSLDTTRLLAGYPAAAPVPALPAGLPNPAAWAALSNGDGTAWAGPWGTSFAANLTPHETGLAAWTPELFIQAMRTGKHMGTGRAVLPPMPWQDYGQMTDDDLRAVFAYLRSLKAVANAVPAPVPPKSERRASALNSSRTVARATYT